MTADRPADVLLRPAEAPIVGRIPGLRGRTAVLRVIDQLLGGRR